MNAQEILNLLTEAGVIPLNIGRVSIIASVDGYLSINCEYIPPKPTNDDELNRLRLIEKLATKMVKLQLEDGQVDDRLAEQVKALIDPARGQEA